MPAGVKCTPHIPVSQVRARHSLSLPGQSVGSRQPTQLPLPSQKRPLPQGVRRFRFRCEGTPLVHTSPVQGF
jgi:hypothetical protein